MKPFHPSSTTQNGSALVVALIMLLLLTMLGVQGMRTNVMQERMAGNMRDRNLAFQASEAILREGEDWIANNSATAADANPVPINWEGEQVGLNYTGTSPSFDTRLSDAPVYHAGPPEYVRVGLALPPDWRYLYPVTAYAQGGMDSTVVIVQSSFEPAQ